MNSILECAQGLGEMLDHVDGGCDNLDADTIGGDRGDTILRDLGRRHSVGCLIVACAGFTRKLYYIGRAITV